MGVSNRKFGPAACALVFLALSACASSAPPKTAAPPPPPPAPPPELEAGKWSLSSFDGAPPPSALSVGFESGSLKGEAFCNKFFGDYRKEGATLRIVAVGTTRKACPELDAEQKFFGVFTETSSYEIDPAGQLTLVDRDGGRGLVFARP